VPEARLQVLGLGESDRLDPGTSESARVRNRRVEIYRKL
jgi:flagellar motor protein MotB